MASRGFNPGNVNNSHSTYKGRAGKVKQELVLKARVKRKYFGSVLKHAEDDTPEFYKKIFAEADETASRNDDSKPSIDKTPAPKPDPLRLARMTKDQREGEKQAALAAAQKEREKREQGRRDYTRKRRHATALATKRTRGGQLNMNAQVKRLLYQIKEKERVGGN